MTTIHGRLELGPPTGAGELYISSQEAAPSSELIDLLRPLLGQTVKIVRQIGRDHEWLLIEAERDVVTQ
jgi:hypothetical protein